MWDSEFHSLLANAFKRHSHLIALKTDNRSWTYYELWSEVVRMERILASHLRSDHGRLPVIATYLSRGAPAVAAMLAIMRAGGVYMPLELSLPRNRIQFLLDDARPVAIVTSGSQAGRCGTFSGVPLVVADGPEDSPTYKLRRRSRSLVPAYLLYTSGSSSMPKGVLGTYRGLLNRIIWMQQHYPFAKLDVGCHRTSLGFVDSLGEVFSPLADGAPLVIEEQEAGGNTDRLLDLLEKHKVTRLTLVPSLLRILMSDNRVDVRMTSLRLCSVSGEPLPKSLALEFVCRFPNCRLLNFYGSTEVTADVTCHEVTPSDERHAHIPIGRPLREVEIRVLKDDLSEATQGEIGELFVFSDTAVADGYLQPPAQSDSFLRNRFFPASVHTKVYRTGDLGFHTGGLFFYSGRKDLSYKLGGRKINPFEIEQLDERLTAVVRPINGSDKLVGFVVGVHENDFHGWAQSFLHSARSTLPSYMIPRLFCLLDQLPVKTNGKVDRQALVQCNGLHLRHADVVRDGPGNELEIQVHRIVADFLRVEAIDRHTNFFDIGLTSIEVPSLLVRLNNFFTHQLSLTEFYPNASVAAVAQAVSTSIPASETLFLIHGEPGGRPVFVVHPAGGLSFVYRPLAGRLAGYCLYGLNSPCFGRSGKEYSDVNALAAFYLDTIAEYQRKELALAGWSFGGEVAYEMAVQLEAQGRQARRLVLIDTTRSGELSRDSEPSARRTYFLRNGIDPTSDFARVMLAEMEYHDMLSLRYIPRALTRTQVVLLKASESSSSDDHNGWLPYCKAGLRVIDVLGSHDYLLNEWSLEGLARGLRLALDDDCSQQQHDKDLGPAEE